MLHWQEAGSLIQKKEVGETLAERSRLLLSFPFPTGSKSEATREPTSQGRADTLFLQYILEDNPHCPRFRKKRHMMRGMKLGA